ncbi:hypothetical protein D3C86_1459200 [compost metagenome]
MPIVSCAEQTIENLLQGFPGFERLAIRQDDRAHRITAKRGLERIQVKRRDRLIGNDGHLATNDMRRQQIRATQ